MVGISSTPNGGNFLGSKVNFLTHLLLSFLSSVSTVSQSWNLEMYSEISSGLLLCMFALHNLLTLFLFSTRLIRVRREKIIVSRLTKLTGFAACAFMWPTLCIHSVPLLQLCTILYAFTQYLHCSGGQSSLASAQYLYYSGVQSLSLWLAALNASRLNLVLPGSRFIASLLFTRTLYSFRWLMMLSAFLPILYPVLLSCWEYQWIFRLPCSIFCSEVQSPWLLPQMVKKAGSLNSVWLTVCDTAQESVINKHGNSLFHGVVNQT